MTTGPAPDAGVDPASHPDVLRVRAALDAHHVTAPIVTLPTGANTAALAAAALGIDVGQIADSLVFVATGYDGMETPLLVMVSGAHRVDVSKLAELLDTASIDTAAPDIACAATGFSAGGIAPLGHLRPVHTVVDVHLSRYDEIWVAAGHPRAVFRTTYEELLRITAGQPIEAI